MVNHTPLRRKKSRERARPRGGGAGTQERCDRDRVTARSERPRQSLNKRPRRVHIPGHGSPVSCRAVGLIGAALVIAAFSPAGSCFSPPKLRIVTVVLV